MEIKKLESILTALEELQSGSGNRVWKQRIKIIRNPEPKKIKKSKEKAVEQIVTVTAPKEDTTKDIVSSKVGYCFRQKKKAIRHSSNSGNYQGRTGCRYHKSMNLEHEVASRTKANSWKFLWKRPARGIRQPIMRLKVDDLTSTNEGDNK